MTNEPPLFNVGDILQSLENGSYILVTGFDYLRDRYTFLRFANGEVFSNPRFYVDRWLEKVS